MVPFKFQLEIRIQGVINEYEDDAFDIFSLFLVGIYEDIVAIFY